jgi:hypothetical protein
MLHYTGFNEDDEVQGIIMMYKDFSAVYILEQVLDNRSEIKAKQRETMENLRCLLCKVMVGLQEQRHYN